MAIHDAFYTNTFLEAAEFHKMSSAPRQVEFIEQSIPLRPGDRILDLACGFGRHSLLLAQKGYSVVGFDHSSDFIQKAKADAERLALQVEFMHGDMRELSFAEEFDVVVSLQSSLAFYDDDANKDIFRRIGKALKPGGTFLFDQVNIFTFAAFANESKILPKKVPEGQIWQQTLSFDAATCVGHGRYLLDDGHGREEAGWDLRWYTLPELKTLVNEAGLQVIHSYGAFDGSPYTVTSPRMIAKMNCRTVPCI